MLSSILSSVVLFSVFCVCVSLVFISCHIFCVCVCFFYNLNAVIVVGVVGSLCGATVILRPFAGIIHTHTHTTQHTSKHTNFARYAHFMSHINEPWFHTREIMPLMHTNIKYIFVVAKCSRRLVLFSRRLTSSGYFYSVFFFFFFLLFFLFLQRGALHFIFCNVICRRWWNCREYKHAANIDQFENWKRTEWRRGGGFVVWRVHIIFFQRHCTPLGFIVIKL